MQRVSSATRNRIFLVLIVELWLSNVMQRVSPFRYHRGCRVTLSPLHTTSSTPLSTPDSASTNLLTVETCQKKTLDQIHRTSSAVHRPTTEDFVHAQQTTHRYARSRFVKVSATALKIQSDLGYSRYFPKHTSPATLPKRAVVSNS